METELLIEILEKNQQNIEKGNWEDVYEDFMEDDYGEFTDFLIENGIHPSTLFKKYIPEFGFCHSKLLESIIIPASITGIPDGTFLGCKSLKSITIPNSVEEIGGYAFFECTSLTEIKYDGTEAEWNKIEFGQDWNNKCPAKITFLK